MFVYFKMENLIVSKEFYVNFHFVYFHSDIHLNYLTLTYIVNVRVQCSTHIRQFALIHVNPLWKCVRIREIVEKDPKCISKQKFFLMYRERFFLVGVKVVVSVCGVQSSKTLILIETELTWLMIIPKKRLVD